MIKRVKTSTFTVNVGYPYGQCYTVKDLQPSDDIHAILRRLHQEEHLDPNRYRLHLAGFSGPARMDMRMEEFDHIWGTRHQGLHFYAQYARPVRMRIDDVRDRILPPDADSTIDVYPVPLFRNACPRAVHGGERFQFATDYGQVSRLESLLASETSSFRSDAQRVLAIQQCLEDMGIGIGASISDIIASYQEESNMMAGLARCFPFSNNLLDETVDRHQTMLELVSKSLNDDEWRCVFRRWRLDGTWEDAITVLCCYQGRTAPYLAMLHSRGACDFPLICSKDQPCAIRNVIQEQHQGWYAREFGGLMCCRAKPCVFASRT